MYPGQTSLIPIQIALARFLENHGLRAIFSNYPYWYLGTTPWRYLTGPVLPAILVGLHKIFPNFSLFDIMFGLLAAAWAIGGIGVYFLVKNFQGDRGKPGNLKAAFLAAIFYLFGPIVPFLFSFSDGLYLMGFCLLPFALLGYLEFLKKKDQKSTNYLIAAMTMIMLVDIALLPSLILGMAAVFLATFGWKKAEEKIKRTLNVVLFAILIATIWYSPAYWWQLLTAPSFAGKSLFKVIGQLGQLLPISLVFGLAIVSDKFFKLKSKIGKFCFYWLFIFGFLTLIRFISDPDFWLDWTAYGSELQLGLAIGGGLAVNKLLKTFYFLIVTFTFYFLLFTFITKKYIFGALQKDITQTVEYKIGSQLAKVMEPEEKVFLSGSTVFWLNAFFDIVQVRGGVDQVSVHPEWRQAAWEIREGPSTSFDSVRDKSSGQADAKKWLKELSVSYLVVHTEESEEFYHDFRHPEKFEGVEGLKKIYDKDGDRIYIFEDR